MTAPRSTPPPTCRGLPTLAAHRHRGRAHPRHRGLHVPRAGPRQGGRQARRHLGLRRRALRDAHRPPALRGRDAVRRPGGGPEDGPRLDALPAGVPPRVRRLLGRCLQKDPKQRLHDIADARIELADEEDVAPVAPAVAPPRRAAALVPWAVAALAIAASAAWALLGGRPGPATVPALKLAVLPPIRHGVLGAHRHLARRATDRLHGRRHGRPGEALRPGSRRPRAEGPPRHRGRGRPLLLAGRALRRLLRREEAEARRPRRGAGARAGRRPGPSRRELGLAEPDRLRPGRRRPDLPRPGLGRRRHGGDSPRPGDAGDLAPLAAFPARRQALPVHEPQAQSPGPARDRGGIRRRAARGPVSSSPAPGASSPAAASTSCARRRSSRRPSTAGRSRSPATRSRWPRASGAT